MSGPGRASHIRGNVTIPLVLVALVGACAAVAALLERPAWAAAVGGGLVLAYWGVERAIWRRAERRDGLALGTAIAGMLLRLGLVIGSLVVLAAAARAALPTAIAAFVVCFTVYAVVRLAAHPGVSASGAGAS